VVVLTVLMSLVHDSLKDLARIPGKMRKSVTSLLK
jgi:translation initiation factor IF-1